MLLGTLRSEPRLKRRIIRICLVSILLYASLCAGGCAFQRRLIYFPTKLGPDSAEKMADREGFLAWRNKAGEIIGWKLPANDPPSASVLVVHGNAGCALDRVY